MRKTLIFMVVALLFALDGSALAQSGANFNSPNFITPRFRRVQFQRPVFRSPATGRTPQDFQFRRPNFTPIRFWENRFQYRPFQTQQFRNDRIQPLRFYIQTSGANSSQNSGRQ